MSLIGVRDLEWVGAVCSAAGVILRLRSSRLRALTWLIIAPRSVGWFASLCGVLAVAAACGLADAEVLEDFAFDKLLLVNFLRRGQESELDLGGTGRYRILIGPHCHLWDILADGTAISSRIRTHVQGALAKRVLLEFRTYRTMSWFQTLISWGCLFQHSFEAFGGLGVDQTGLGQALLVSEICDETFRNCVVLVSPRQVELRWDEASDFSILRVLEVILIIRLQKRRWRSCQHILVPILCQHTIWVNVH